MTTMILYTGLYLLCGYVMADAFRGIYLYGMIMMVISLNGCGDGSMETINEQNIDQVASKSYEDFDLEPFRLVCVDNQLPSIQADYEECLIYDILNQGYCETRRAGEIASLNAQWNSIVTRFGPQVESCYVDPRTTKEYCDAQARVWLGTQSNLCMPI